ncbi:hypothetical protein [Cellulophaga omnivescoria]|uniref:hypothetical protein n=1 Tax=Cellulophaga omnivescoria TaxID=1888890 RepID=UPI0022F121F4|nr:hypothetical protein [Cellulophaga omnivescoria]WBU90891.1 hypothetical protein PBN93_07680 [Cellulophaga omnivescoria]WKB83027.1 hypothetical protein QYR09_08280 [Cellulophaga lytica]
MKRFFLFLIVIFSLVSCTNTKKEVVKEEQIIDEITFNAKKLPKKIKLDSKVVPVLENWQEYKDFNTAIDGLYKAENDEDLRLTLDQIIEAQKKLEKSVYPEEFNKPHIKSRQTVVKTYTLKTKAAIEYSLNVLEPASELINAYNSFRNQFNIIANNTLDTNLILENE